MELSKKTEQELKALAFDCVVQRDNAINLLQQIAAELDKRSKKNSKTKAS